MVGAAYHPPPTSPQPWGCPLPGDHLWAQLCFLLGDAGAEGTTFAHPVGLQGPEAGGHRCYLLQVVSLDPPSNADPRITHQVTLLHFLPDTYCLLKPLFGPTYIAMFMHVLIQQTFIENLLCARACQGTNHSTMSGNDRSNLPIY